MKVTHFKKVSETSGVCVLLRLYLIYNRIIYTVRSLYETFK